MNYFRVKAKPFSGTRYADVAPQARALLRSIAKKTKRQPYLRSAYFNKEKIFFSYFWVHLSQRSPRQRAKRLRYLPCAAELIKESRQKPESKENPNKRGEYLHRFFGISPNGIPFVVQIKESKKKKKRKELMSVFPYK